jgi:hypothetical protein
MKREVIERLAIDSAAGELNDDALALFDAYLAEHPQAGQWAEDILRIYKETETAIDAKTRDADAGVGMPAVKISRLSELKWLSFGRWAAALIVGALVGFTGGRWPITGKTSSVDFAQLQEPAAQVETISDLKEKYAGTFWGDKVLALLESRSGQRYKADFQDVGFWHEYRQRIKEKHYE